MAIPAKRFLVRHHRTADHPPGERDSLMARRTLVRGAQRSVTVSPGAPRAAAAAGPKIIPVSMPQQVLFIAMQ
jgi:hypothetical protein